jgi:hypothetical protein
MGVVNNFYFFDTVHSERQYNVRSLQRIMQTYEYITKG